MINRQKLSALLGIKDNDQLSEYHREWVEEVLKNGSNQRDAKWTQSIAVGDKVFVMETKIWFKIGSIFYILKILPLQPYEQKGYNESPWIV